MRAGSGRIAEEFTEGRKRGRTLIEQFVGVRPERPHPPTDPARALSSVGWPFVWPLHCAAHTLGAPRTSGQNVGYGATNLALVIQFHELGAFVRL
jgi:hypothetical protein